LENFRRRDWKPALEAAGIPYRRIHDLRSTFASHALAAGVSAFELARIMGTSVRMIEAHSGALLQGSAAAIRSQLDALDDRLGQEQAAADEAESGAAESKPPLCSMFERWSVPGSNRRPPACKAWRRSPHAAVTNLNGVAVRIRGVDGAGG
jgi:hypothetical protein